MFSDITNYEKTRDYLPILNAIIIVDIIIMILVFRKIIKPRIIYNWYKNYKLYGSLVDITTIFIVILSTRYMYSLWKTRNNSYGFDYSMCIFMIIAIFCQICYDVTLYNIIQTIPVGANQMIDMFRKYTKESTLFIFTLDCSFVLLSIIFASIFNNYSMNINIIILISLLNILPFIVFSN
jgi:hypothetical protein